MKLKLTFLVFACSAFLLSVAQNPITLTTSDMPTVPWSQSVAIDTPLSTLNYGTAGANQVYNFSALSNTETQTVQYINPTNTQRSYFPNASMAITADNSTFVFARNSASYWDAEGLQAYGYGQINYVQFSPVEDIFKFTTQYQETYTGSWGFQQVFTGAQLGQSSADSIRITYTDNFTDVIDGWGKTITPVGAYKSLREKRTDQTARHVDAYVCFIGCSWQTDVVNPVIETTTEYTYLAKETKGALVSFDYDSAGDLLAAKYSLISPAAPVPSFTDVAGSNGLITFTDATDGYPTKWHWNFGDGDTSNLQSPAHTYTTNGTYYVCETVYNAGGSNTYCDSVHVTGISSGPTAHFTFVNGVGGQVTFTDGSTGSPVYYHWNFGDGDTSNVASPTHTYTNDGTYYVCETVRNSSGNNTYCDSVHVSNAPGPVAHFAWAAGNNGSINFTNSSTGNPVYYHWNFGDSDTSNVASPNHVYTTDGTYYVCETVRNINGSNTYCDSVHVTNAPGPVAHFSWVAAGGGLINFTNSSTGNPVYYHWTFGDGDTSNLVSPGHTYAANGSYYACETVRNANGSNTYCDSVHVTGILSGHQPPVAIKDTGTVIKPNSDTIHVTANDYSPTGDTFCVTNVSNPTYFTVLNCNDVVFNCANAPAPGIDSAWYVICNVSQPTLCDSALIIVTVNRGHSPPVANNDTSTVMQPNSDTINVTGNDYSPSNDSFCVTSVYGSTFFTQLGCNDVVFTPDSTFTGNDTAWYVICNTGQPNLCDTAMVVVKVKSDTGTRPVANYQLDFNNLRCNSFTVYNTSQDDTGTVTWRYIAAFTNDTTIRYGDTAYFFNFNSVAAEGTLCIFVANQFGKDTFCNQLNLPCEGINAIALGGISIYPNPATNNLTIDMSANNSDVTKNYTAIEIYNALGQKVITIPRSGQPKLVNIPVGELAAGLYLSTIVDNNGTRSALGKFMKE